MLEHVTTEPTECARRSAAAGAPAAPGVCSSAAMVAVLADFVVSGPAGAAGAVAGAPGGPSGAAGAGDGATPRPPPARRAGAGRAPAPADAKAVVEEAARSLGCKSERCALAHPRLADFVEQVKGAGAAEALKAAVEVRFKPAGPRNSTALLSNFDIDGVLERWAGEAPFGSFFNCPFAMMDFDREAYPFGTLSMADVRRGAATQQVRPEGTAEAGPVRRPCDTFACVLNTDTSTGPGKHWVCVFVDMRPPPGTPWTVEYFNSAGNAPPRAMTRWLARTCDVLIEAREAGPAGARAVTVTSVTHQRSRTECGPYTLYYLRARLEGVPAEAFTEQRTTDQEMVEFRRHLFSSSD